jgi:hypothetical protein
MGHWLEEHFMKQIAAAALLLLAVQAVRADDADSPAMTIDAGRLGVMMDQAQRILGLPDADDQDSNTETFAVLKNAVRTYQRLVPVACARHIGKAPCDRPSYAPAWLQLDTVPPPEVLRARIDEATDPVSALWNALCDTLPKDHDPSLCQLE